METLRFGRLGLEDLRVGRGTFEETLADGSVETLQEVPLGVFIAENGGTIGQSLTTFSAFNVSYLVFNNIAATTVTKITDGVDGQLLYLKFDGLTTLAQLAGGTGQIALARATNVLFNNSQVVLFFYDGIDATWRQVGIDPNTLVAPVRIVDSQGNLIHAFGTTV